ncbi:hypothetical protein ABZP36_015511 [Zizania latifolia]
MGDASGVLRPAAAADPSSLSYLTMLGNCPLIAVVLAGAIAQFIKSLSVEIDRIKKENDNMQIELRHLKGEDINSLQPKELIMIEEALDNGLTNVHEKLMDDWEWLARNV